MKKIFKLMSLALAVYAVAACEEKPINNGPGDDPKVELNQDLDFTLEVVSVDANTAKVKVTTNGSTSDTWYGFHTTEVSKSEGELIQEEVEAMLATGKVSGLKKQTSATVSLRGLDPQTDYKYIVFGLSSDGEVYGMYNSVEFTTTKDTGKLEQTDDWKITYQRGESQGEVIELFTVECAEGKGYYFTTIDVLSLEVSGFTAEDYVRYVIDTEVPALLQYYNWEALYIPEAYTLSSSRAISGDYIAFAIGYDSKGNPTGYYSAQDFTVEEEVANEDYSQWLGDWGISCTYEYQDEATGETLTGVATYYVTLHHYDNNFIYAMTGWESAGDIENNITEYVGEYPVPVYYDNGKLSFKEVTLDYVEFQDAGQYTFGFYGVGNLTYQGKSYEGSLIAFEGVTMAVGETTDGGQTGVINGTSHSIDGYDIDYIGMFYCAYSNDLAYWNPPMTFPLTMERQAAPASSVMLNVPSVKPVDLKTKSMKKIQKKEFTPMYLD